MFAWRIIDRFFAQTLDRLLDCVRFCRADAQTFAESTYPSAARSDGPRGSVELAPYDDDTSRCGSRSRQAAGQTQRARRSELQCLPVPGGSAGVRLRDDENSPRSCRCDAIATSQYHQNPRKNQRRLRGRFLSCRVDRRRTMRSTFFSLAAPLRPRDRAVLVSASRERSAPKMGQ